MERLRLRLVEADGTPIRWLKDARDIEYGDVENAGGKLSFTLSARTAGYLEPPFNVEVRYTVDGGRSQPFDRSNLFRIEEDDSDDKSTRKDVTYSSEGEVFKTLPEQWVMGNERTKDDRREFYGPSGEPLSAGAILLEELEESKTYGWAPHVVLDFSATHDSNGEPWQAADKSAFSLPVPSHQGQLVDALVDQSMCEVEARGPRLRVLRPGATRDRTHVVLGGTGFTKAPVKTSVKGFYNRLTVYYDGGDPFWVWVPDGDMRFGVVDALLTLDGVTDYDVAMRAAQAHIAQGTKKREESYEWTPRSSGVVPGRDIRVSDTVTAIARGGERPRRVVGLVLSDKDGKCTAKAIVGERIGTQTEQFKKKLGSLTLGGSTTGGSGVAFTPAPPVRSAKPLAPVGLHIVSNTGSWGPDGSARSEVKISWAGVTRAEDGSEVTISEYEVAVRPASGTLAAVTRVTDPTVLLDQLPTGQLRLVAVRAKSTRGTWSEYSLELPVTPATPASIIPKAPGLPTVVSHTPSWTPTRLGVDKVIFTWPEVTQSTDNEPVTVEAYLPEVEDGDAWVVLAPVGPGPRQSAIDVPSGGSRRVRVRAQGPLNVAGDPSPILTITGQQPAQVTTPLEAPTFVTGALRVAIYTTLKLQGGAAAPATLDKVWCEFGATSSGPWKRMSAPATKAGQVGELGGTLGEEIWLRLIWADVAGRESDPSVAVKVIVDGVGANDIIAGSIKTNHLEPALGSQISFSAERVVILTGQAQDAQDQLAAHETRISEAKALAQAANNAASAAGASAGSAQIAAAAAQAAAAQAQADTDQLGQYFVYSSDGLAIGKPGSPMTTNLTNQDWSIRRNGVAKVWVNEQGLIASTAQLDQLIIGGTVIEASAGGVVWRVA